jgi:hypothetical protein
MLCWHLSPLARLSLGSCLSTADSNVAHPRSRPSCGESVYKSVINTISVHGFHPVQLHQQFMRLRRRRFPQFVAELDVHSLLHCTATVPHTDYVPTARSEFTLNGHVLYARRRFSMYLWIAMCVQAHLALDSHVRAGAPGSCLLPLRYPSIYRTF